MRFHLLRWCPRSTLVNVATERWFLKIDGIAGESADAAHKGEIEVESWSWGLSNTGSTSSGGGAGSGRVSFRDFHFVTRISTASPSLVQACATGSHLKEANLSGVRSVGQGKGIDFLEYRLRDVLVTSVDHGDGAADVPSEQFSLSYAKIEMSYIPQSASGKMGAAVAAGYDLKKNRKI